MSLRALATADLRNILEDEDTGFGWPVTVKDPTGKTDSFVGFSNDISQVIDPDTGLAVSGRLASVGISTTTLTEKGFDLPVGIADSGSKPWLVTFDDIGGNSFTFKVSKSSPDRALGLIICLLELYQ